MATNETDLLARARAAYEIGRLRWSFRTAPLILGAAAVALACGRPVALIAALCGVLLPLAVGLSYAGGGAGRAVLPGLLGGAAALAPPVLLHTIGHACVGPACMILGIPACVIGGALGGVVIARRAAAAGEGLSFVCAAAAVAALTGALGCSIAGAAGVLGMLAGTVAAGAPVLIAARR
jgi:hypothetical protein